ncbi:MAG: hypothetical protein IJ784_05960 [Ruminiclostridium sp.]|nr:hypothetical protein [Ruminiclostridium sp.]
MKNGNVEQFLDTGWYSESTLYYNGYIYWFEGSTDSETNISTFFIDRWRAKLTDDMYCREYRLNNDIVDYKRVFESRGTDMDLLKKQFLEAPIFDGKTFWDIESELVWADEDKPIVINSLSELEV